MANVDPRPASRAGSEHTDWYLSGKQGLRGGIRLLESVKQELLSLGRIDEKWHDLLDKAFGPQFLQLLTQWAPSHPAAPMLADQLIRHCENLRFPFATD